MRPGTAITSDYFQVPALFNEGRIGGLDGLRGIAIVMVTLFHAVPVIAPDSPAWFRTVVRHGDFGVDVFFVISGFLITHLLLQERLRAGTIDLRAFYMRRMFRLAPAYYSYLCVVALFCAVGWMRMSPLAWVSALTYTTNFYRESVQYPIAQTWSLSLEEQFYLVWPPLLVALRPKVAVSMLLSTIVLCPVLRIVLWNSVSSDVIDADSLLLARADTLGVGCLLAYLLRSPWYEALDQKLRGKGTLTATAAIGVICASLYVLSESGKYYLGPKRMIEAGSVATIALVCATQPDAWIARIVNCPLLMYVGTISYSLYLAQGFITPDRTIWPVGPLASVACAAIYTILSFYIVERPMLRLRDWLLGTSVIRQAQVAERTDPDKPLAPLISVVIPTFNYGHLVGEAVDSALAQTYPNVEIVVVDDGSTDETRERLAKYGDRIRYHYQPNAGLSAARNAGIGLAKGEFIALLDSDDAFHPEKLAIQAAVLTKHPHIGLVGTDAFSDEPVKWSSVRLADVEAVIEPVTLEQAVIRAQFAPSSVLARRDCFQRAGLFDTQLKSVEDRDMWIRIAACASLAIIRHPLTWYRQTPGSMSRNAAKMEHFERVVLDKAFAMPELRGRWLLRQKAFGLAAYSAAFMYLSSGERNVARRRMISSFLQWPLPISVPHVRYHFARTRLLLRSSLAGMVRK